MKNDTKNNTQVNDDPRLTAYALGELESAADIAAIEQRLAGDAALRSEVDSIRATAVSLRAAFAAEPAASLTDSQRSSILRTPALRVAMAEAARDVAADDGDDREAAGLPRIFVLRSRWIGMGLAAAAMIALTITAAIMFNNDGTRNSGVAINAPAPAEQGAASLEHGRGAGAPERMSSDLRDSTSPPPPMLAQTPPPGMVDALAKKASDGMRSGDASSLRSDSKDKQEGERRESAARPNAPESSAGAAGADGLSARAADPAPAAAASNTPPVASPAPAQQPAAPGAGGAAPVGGAAVAGGGGRAAESPPAPSISPGKPQTGGPTAATSPDVTRQRNAETPPASRDRDDDVGSLRQPTRESAEAAPVTLLDEEEITQMPEGEVRAALKETESLRTAANSNQLRRQLERQLDHLGGRLRAIEAQNAEEYSRINDNPFIKPQGEAALSTFAADVDTASYSNVRRMLNEGRLPPADAVRIEEMINYFRYDYSPPSAGNDADAAAGVAGKAKPEQPPFSANVEVAPAPWHPEHRLVRVGLRGKEVRMDMRPATSLIFLVDVSGSMNQPDKLPLVKASLKKLVAQLHGDDRLAIVTYQGNAGLALDSCYVNAENREKIDAAIDTMQPGGSTNGAGGINLAYDIARQHFIQGGINRVLLCTDGDFNVGVSSDDALVQLIEAQRTSGVFLSVLGFGAGNLKDAKMEKLSNAGNGNYAYIDSLAEGNRVLVEQGGGTLVTIAKDVKFQVEFNPAKVGAYRLIGYEDRLLNAEDFNNDAKDAGEIGSGHTMTALYEIVPVGEEADALALNQPAGEVDELEYQQPAGPPPVGGDAAAANAISDNLLTVKIRYKQPDGDESSPLRFPVKDTGKSLDEASVDFRFASAVAEFGMLLRRSPYKGGATFDHVLFQAQGSIGDDEQGYRAQFMDLVRKAQVIDKGE